MKADNLLDMWRNRQRRTEVYSAPEFWDAKAKDLAGAAVSMWPNNNLNRLYHEEQLRQLESFLPNVKGLQVLDLGCGTGRMSRYLAERGAQVLGVDFSAKAIEIARSLSSGDNPRYRVQSLFDLDDHKTFDVAITWCCLTMACKSRVELQAALTRIREALRPGGTLALLEPIHRGFMHRVLDMDSTEFCKAMREVGFEVGQVRQMHFWPARLGLAFISWPATLTRLGYQCGQACLRLPGLGQMGDYKAIRGVVSTRKAETPPTPG